MRLKLDENFDLRLVPVLNAAGNDVDTVLAEGLSGRDDETIYQNCMKERRVLITLDKDFSNPFRFPPSETEGIKVVRPPRPVLRSIQATLLSAMPTLEVQALRGRLWIVEPGRIRMYDPAGTTERESQGPEEPFDPALPFRDP